MCVSSPLGAWRSPPFDDFGGRRVANGQYLPEPESAVRQQPWAASLFPIDVPVHFALVVTDSLLLFAPQAALEAP